MNITYIVLFLAITTGVMQATLDKGGVGRVENLSPSNLAIVLTLLSIPLALLSNLGLIVTMIWSLFALSWLATLGIIATSLIGFSLIWGSFLGSIRRSQSWGTLCTLGIPLVFLLRLICSMSVVYLCISYAKI